MKLCITYNLYYSNQNCKTYKHKKYVCCIKRIIRNRFNNALKML